MNKPLNHHNRKVIFIGAINIGKQPTGGEEYKNQILLKYLTAKLEIFIIDTYLWQKRPIVLIQLLISILAKRRATIILSASTVSSFRFLSLLNLLEWNLNRVYYFVIGGYLPDFISSAPNTNKVNLYTKIRKIYVEGKTMKDRLLLHGIERNCEVLPNCKEINSLYIKSNKAKHEFSFVFISRITESKGILDIIKSTTYIKQERPDLQYSIDFYGKAIQKQDQNIIHQIQENEACYFKGYLDILGEPQQAYETLSSYDCLLFPTFWPGEGFPGVIIDAFICGLPVIASDWNLNTELIEHLETGYIVPPKDPLTLAKAMIWCMENPEKMREMSRNCYKKAYDYDTSIVLDRVLNEIHTAV